jgi:hypothetical protein
MALGGPDGAQVRGGRGRRGQVHGLDGERRREKKRVRELREERERCPLVWGAPKRGARPIRGAESPLKASPVHGNAAWGGEVG